MIPVAKPYLTELEAQCAYDTILSGWVTQGPRVQEFEEKFAKYTDAKYAVALSNCTTALHLAMIVAGIKEGDEVICPSMSYVATANSIKYVGAKPVFAEVNSNYNLDVGDVRKKITDKTKAILLVHQIGMPADIDMFKELSSQCGLILIEDAACAVGSSYKGKKIGSHSDLVCFSFHPRKVITTGDGGMITTSNESYYNRLKLLRQHAMSVTDRERHVANKIIFEDHLEVGYNYRMTDIQASVGIKQLEKLDYIVEERRKIAEKYNSAFSGLKNVRIQIEPKDRKTNWQSYMLYINPENGFDRNLVMSKLLENGISSRRGIMTAHRESAYIKDYNDVKLPISEGLSDNTIILPLYVPMNQKDIDSVIFEVTRLFSN
jgi:perosamine synthetase